MAKKRLLFSKAVVGFEPITIKASAVERFLRQNSSARDNFSNSTSSIDLFEKINSSDLENGIKLLNECQIPNNLDSIESIFEALLTDGHVKNLGAVYTPSAIRDFIIHESIRNSSNKMKPWLPRILDPACGSAGFLISAAEILNKSYKIPIDTIFNECILGIDICKEAVDNATCICNLYVSSKGINSSSVRINIIKEDALLTDSHNLLLKIGHPEGVDVLCTNPPYVKLQNLSTTYREDLISKYSMFVKGSFSLAPLFLIQGIKLLKATGCLGFITQNNFPTSLSGEPVRAFIQQQGSLIKYIDFGHQQIFEDASAYTCLMFAGKTVQTHFEYSSHKGTPSEESLNSLIYSKVQFSGLNSKKWRIGEEDHLKQLKMIEAFGNPLGEMSAIRVGFATLKDDVFFIRENQSHLIENFLLKPAVKISEFNTQAELEANKLQIIFPYQKIGPKYELIPEDYLATQFPKAYSYLCEKRDALESRDKGKKSYPAWYAWGRTQGMTAPGPKLLTKTFSQGPNFILDTSDSIFCNGYSVTPYDNSLFPSSADWIIIIQKILNSKIMQYYAKLTSFQLEGNFQCFQKNFIEKFGMPNLDDSLTDSLLSKSGEEFEQYLAEKIYKLDWELINRYLDQN